MAEEARFHERIHALAERAKQDRCEFSSPANPPDEERAMEFLREGVGPAISLYIEGRTGGRMIRFPPQEYHALEGAMNTWLELYANCYGANIDAGWTLREAAELLIDTHNVRDSAVMLTHIPTGAKSSYTEPAND